MKKETATTIGVVIGTVLGVLALSLLVALPVMLLWDAVVPDVFGLTEITFLQAWGLSLLCGILFRMNHASA